MIAGVKISGDYRDSVTKYPPESLDDAETLFEIPWESGIVPVLESHPRTRFMVFVPDVRTMALAGARLSRGLQFDVVTLETGRLALTGRGDKKWREYVRGIGSLATQGVLLRLAIRAMERGAQIGPFALIVDAIILGDANPYDADILSRALTLQTRRK